jgi:hypothetical protein
MYVIVEGEDVDVCKCNTIQTITGKFFVNYAGVL